MFKIIHCPKCFLCIKPWTCRTCTWALHMEIITNRMFGLKRLELILATLYIVLSRYTNKGKNHYLGIPLFQPFNTLCLEGNSVVFTFLCTIATSNKKGYPLNRSNRTSFVLLTHKHSYRQSILLCIFWVLSITFLFIDHSSALFVSFIW